MSDFVIRIAIDPTAAQAGGAAAETALDKTSAAGKKAQESTDDLAKRFKALENAIDPTIAASRQLSAATDLLFQAQRAGLVTGEETIRLLELQTAQLTGQIRPYEAKLAALERETELLKLSDGEREIATRMMQIENELRLQGITLTNDQTAALENQLRAQQGLNEVRAAQRAEAAEQGAGSMLGAAGGQAAGLAKSFAVAAGGIELFKLTDELGQLHNQLRVVTTDADDFNKMQERLYQVAQHTRTGWEETVHTYSRVFQATRELGLSEDEVANFTLQLSEAFKVAGVSAGEQARVTRDLLHGIDQGTLQWRQLQAIMAQTPSVARIVAEHFHVTTGELKALATQGKITARDIVDAFNEAAPKIESDFGKTAPTLSQSWTKLENAIMHLLNVLTPVIEFIAKGINLIADALGFVSEHAEAAAVALSFLTPAGPLILGIDLAYHGVKLLGDALSDLGDVIGLTGSLMDTEAGQALKLQMQIDAMTESIDKSAASFYTFNTLMEMGIDLPTKSAAAQVGHLVQQIKELQAATTKIAAERFYGIGEFKGEDNIVKEQTRDAIHRQTKAHEEAEKAARAHAEELKRLQGQLDNLAGAADAGAKAEEDYEKALRLVNQAAKDGLPITAEVLAGLEAKRRKVVELAQLEAQSSVEAHIRTARQASDILALRDEVDQADARLKKLREGNNALMEPDWNEKTKEQLDAVSALRGEMDRLSHSADNTLVNAFNKASDALANFLRTGEFNFTEFVSSILDDLEKLLVKKALLALLGGLLGGGGAASGLGGLGDTDLMVPAFAGGGQYIPGGSGGTDSVLNMFRTSPNERVTIETPPQQRASDTAMMSPAPGPPPVLVFDMRSAIAEGLRSPAGKSAIFDVLQEFRDTIGPLSRVR